MTGRDRDNLKTLDYSEKEKGRERKRERVREREREYRMLDKLSLLVIMVDMGTHILLYKNYIFLHVEYLDEG